MSRDDVRENVDMRVHVCLPSTVSLEERTGYATSSCVLHCLCAVAHTCPSLV